MCTGDAPAPHKRAAVIETVRSAFKCMPGTPGHGLTGLSTLPTSPSSAAWGIRERFEQAHDVVRERLVTVHRHQKALFDCSAVPISFTAGEHVWLLVPLMAPGLSSKFFSPWQGPFVVDTQLSDVLYRVTGLQHPFRTLVSNVNRLKPCHRRPADLSTVPEVPRAPPAAPPRLSQPSLPTYVLMCTTLLMRCMMQMLPMLLSDGMCVKTPSLVDRNVTVVFQITLQISLWRCSDLTMTLRPFISVVSYSLLSICLLLVPFSLDLPTFPHV